jgi:hypothetical protein
MKKREKMDERKSKISTKRERNLFADGFRWVVKQLMKKDVLKTKDNR